MQMFNMQRVGGRQDWELSGKKSEPVIPCVVEMQNTALCLLHYKLNKMLSNAAYNALYVIALMWLQTAYFFIIKAKTKY